MLLKILGIVDVVSAGILFLISAGISIPKEILIILGIILLIKSSLGLLRDFGSWMDFLCGVVVLVSGFFYFPWEISMVLGILILQKGIFSFL